LHLLQCQRSRQCEHLPREARSQATIGPHRRSQGHEDSEGSGTGREDRDNPSGGGAVKPLTLPQKGVTVYYIVTVRDSDEIPLGATTVKVGFGRTIIDWLNDHELIDPGDVITIEVREEEV